MACWTRPRGPRRIPARRSARPCPHGRDAGRTGSRRGRRRHRRAVHPRAGTAGGRRRAVAGLDRRIRLRCEPRPFMRPVTTTRRLRSSAPWSATLPTSVSRWRWSIRSRVWRPSSAPAPHRAPHASWAWPTACEPRRACGSGRRPSTSERSRSCGPPWSRAVRSSPRRGSRVVRGGDRGGRRRSRRETRGLIRARVAAAPLFQRRR